MTSKKFQDVMGIPGSLGKGLYPEPDITLMDDTDAINMANARRPTEGAILDAEGAGKLNVRQVHVNRRWENQRRLAAFIKDAARKIGTLEKLRHLATLAIKFDEGTRARRMGLPSLSEFIEDDLAEAEEAIRAIPTLKERPPTNPRALAEKAGAMIIALADGKGVFCRRLPAAHWEKDRWNAACAAVRAGHYHVAPEKFGQKTLILEMEDV